MVAHGERVVQHVAGLLGNVFLGLHKLTRELVEDHLVGRMAQAGVATPSAASSLAREASPKEPPSMPGPAK